MTKEINAVLFDLDGTLLGMDRDGFTVSYFKAITATMAKYGYKPEELAKVIWKGTEAMTVNDGKDTNENVFWRVFGKFYGEKADTDRGYFDDFYLTDFKAAAMYCPKIGKAAAFVEKLKRDYDCRLVLASNPVFPKNAMEERLRWAGINPEDFCFITSYDKMRYCKPNPEYYREILDILSLSPENCVMIGNDVDEDMTAEKIGIETFLLTEYLLNRSDSSIDVYRHGSYDDLAAWLLPLLKK